MKNKMLAAAALVFMPTVLFAQTSAGVSGSTGVSGSASAQVFAHPLKAGEQSSDVKDLQSILKTDPSIYPQGIVSGYYGKLTEDAVRRLQTKYGLPQTGIVDEATERILFPSRVEVTVVSPNGGEVWDKAQAQTVAWKSSFGPREILPLGTAQSGAPERSIMPFYQMATIELIRDSDPNFSYAIGTANLFQSRFEWKIPVRIPEARDYRVRVSFGRRNICVMEMMRTNTDASNMLR
jgi:peptidoglycan hydrolase-like protein with peptidoglycan-binding domain